MGLLPWNCMGVQRTGAWRGVCPVSAPSNAGKHDANAARGSWKWPVVGQTALRTQRSGRMVCGKRVTGAASGNTRLCLPSIRTQPVGSQRRRSGFGARQIGRRQGGHDAFIQTPTVAPCSTSCACAMRRCVSACEYSYYPAGTTFGAPNIESRR